MPGESPVKSLRSPKQFSASNVPAQYLRSPAMCCNANRQVSHTCPVHQTESLLSLQHTLFKRTP